MSEKRILPVINVLESDSLRGKLGQQLRGGLARFNYDKSLDELTNTERVQVVVEARQAVFSGKWTLSQDMETEEYSVHLL